MDGKITKSETVKEWYNKKKNIAEEIKHLEIKIGGLMLTVEVGLSITEKEWNKIGEMCGWKQKVKVVN